MIMVKIWLVHCIVLSNSEAQHRDLEVLFASTTSATLFRALDKSW
jgi:hypothetical protein